MVGPAVPAAEAPIQVEARTPALGLHRRGPRLTLYVDASALVKLFLEEPWSDELEAVFDDAGIKATSRLSYVECHAALARAGREGRATPRLLRSVAEALEERWGDLVVSEVDRPTIWRAATLVHEHALRSSDAIHLATALLVGEGSAKPIRFACFDRRLWEAAGALGLDRVPETAP